MRLWLRFVPLVLPMFPAGVAAAAEGAGPFVQALWLIQRYGHSDVIVPENDRKLKGALSKALGKSGLLTEASANSFLPPSVFSKLAGPDGVLDPSEARNHLEVDMPESRKRLFPRVAEHADLLTTSFDLIDEPHREAAAKLVDWIVANYRSGQPLPITVICTGNSRRSMLGAILGNIAAAYYGMPEIRFHSGGTAPSAFNRRTIATLKEIGVEVEPTGREAARGEPQTANPIYSVRWGIGLEATEFSKTYLDPVNPQHDFAALLVCGEADAGCPVVKGASVRISMPYLDPKIYDDSPFEARKYAERRDDIGRLMLCVMMQVRNRLQQAER